jgi:hypothetical protein
MTQEKLKAMQAESIRRYEIKITWAKTKNPNGRLNRHSMWTALRLDWYGDSCLYCKEYAERDGSCELCPLFLQRDCCGGSWVKMAFSETWAEWIMYAEQVLRCIIDHGTEEGRI